jgi:Holliday junction resolvase RusA-like endonuclease
MEARSVTFTVPGDPVPQPRAKVCVRGGFPKAYYEDNGIVAYREALTLMAIAAGAKATSAAPLVMELELVFQRPPSHFHTSKARAGELKETAKALPRCDSSNCLKGIEDSLNGIAYVDDSQIGRHIIDRRYAMPGEPAYTRVTITEGVTNAATVTESTANR